MKGYFVIVKAKVWDTENSEEYDCIKLFKIIIFSFFWYQLDKERGNDLMDFSVSWVGGENIGLDINEKIREELEDIN